MKQILILALLTLAAPAVPAQSRRGSAPGMPENEIVNRESRVAWYSVWEDAKNEAARSGRPIMLMSAAPRCNEVPGMW
jgi:hypothetical protein